MSIVTTLEPLVFAPFFFSRQGTNLSCSETWQARVLKYIGYCAGRRSWIACVTPFGGISNGWGLAKTPILSTGVRSRLPGERRCDWDRVERDFSGGGRSGGRWRRSSSRRRRECWAARPRLGRKSSSGSPTEVQFSFTELAPFLTSQLIETLDLQRLRYDVLSAGDKELDSLDVTRCPRIINWLRLIMSV